MTTLVDAGLRAPYKGLSPFDDSDVDATLFFGREGETEVVIANALAARLTVLYGPSGVGKSSLLRAGLVHRLRELGTIDALVVVYFSSWAGDPGRALAEAVRGALAATFGGDPGDVPGDVADQIDGWSAALGAQVVLVLDQFEEHFLYHEHDGGVHDLLPELVTRPGLRVNAVLGIRDDELARLDVFKPRIPGMFANSLRLDRLTRESARAAILGPLERYNAFAGDEVVIEPALVEAVLGDVAVGRIDTGLAGKGAAEDRSRVETPYLQLVLQRVWDVEQERGSAVLRLATLAELGGAQQIVEDHLERAMAALSPAQQQVAAGMFDHLVTPSGTKIAHAVADLASFARVEENQLKPVLASLARERILRATGDNTAAGDRYEIYHDVLAGAVLSWKAEHEAEVALAEERTESRRRQRRLAVVAGISLAAFALMAALAVYAFSQRSTARHQADIARVQRSKAVTEKQRAQRARLDALDKSRSYQKLSVRYRKSAGAERVLRNQARAQAATLAQQNSELADKNGQLRTATHVLKQQAAALEQKNGQLRRQQSALARAKTEADLRTRQAVAATAHAVASGLLQRAQAEVVNDPLKSVRDALAAVAMERLPRAEDVLRSSLLATHVVATLPAGGPATDTAYSPDGSRLAIATANGRLRIYALPSGRLVGEIRGRSAVTSIAWSPDSRTIVAGRRDGLAEVVDAGTGTSIRPLDHGAPIVDVDVSPNGRVVATSGGHDTKLWDPVNGALLHTLPHGDRLIHTAEFSDDGSLLVTTAHQNIARVWDVATGGLVQALQQRATINVAAFGPGGTLVATGSQDGTAKIWNSRTGATVETLTGHTASIGAIAFSSAGDRVATASVDGTVRVWSTTTSLVDVVRGFTSPVISVAFSPDGQSEVGLEGDGRAITAGVSQLQMSLVGQTGPARMAVYSPDGSTVATASGNSVWLWEPYGEARLRGIHRHAAPATAVAFSPDGKLLASADAAGTVVVQHAHGGPVRTFSAGAGVVALSWAHNGLLLDARKDGSLQLRRGGDDRIVRVISAEGPITAAALRDDGATVASAGADGIVRVWATASGARLLTINVHAPVAAVALDPTGRWLAVGAGDDVLVYAATTGTKRATLKGHTDAVTGVAFSADGHELASSSRDHDARVWRTTGFHLLQVLHRHTAFISGVAFSGDGRWIATAGALKAGIWSPAARSDLPGNFLLFARGNTTPIAGVAWSPHGWELATASRDGGIRVVDCVPCGGLADLERDAKVRLAKLHR